MRVPPPVAGDGRAKRSFPQEGAGKPGDGHVASASSGEGALSGGVMIPDAAFAFDLVPFLVTLIFERTQVQSLAAHTLLLLDLASLTNYFYFPPF